LPIFAPRHPQPLLERFAKDARLGEAQQIGDLLHRVVFAQVFLCQPPADVAQQVAEDHTLRFQPLLQRAHPTGEGRLEAVPRHRRGVRWGEVNQTHLAQSRFGAGGNPGDRGVGEGENRQVMAWSRSHVVA